MAVAQAESLYGQPVVIDGDSIVVNDRQIRIWGIDAPEMGTREGVAAKGFLRKLVADHTVRCEDNGQHIRGQTTAQCFIGDVDIGRTMVLSGNAVEWRRYSGGFYGR